MRRLASFLVASVLVAVPCCGRTDMNAVVAGTGGTLGFGGMTATGGALAAGGVVGTGGSTSGTRDDALAPNICNWPSCMTSAGKDCLPTGACIQQGAYSTGGAKICYSNGVKEIIGIDGTFNASVRIENGTTTCFTMNGSLLPLVGVGGVVTMSLQNAAGNVIGTISEDPTSNRLTVTCTGSQPVELDPSCITGLSTSNACTSGTCSP